MAGVRGPRAARSTFVDARGDGRGLQLTWHCEADVVVLSLWRDNLCTGSFRLPAEDVPALVAALRSGLEASYDDAVERAASAADRLDRLA